MSVSKILSWIILCLCLFLLSYQDFKERAVNLYLLLVTGILIAIHSFFSEPGKLIFLYTIINVSFLVLDLVILWIYFSVKNKKGISLTKHYLGWGDILFLSFLCIAFNPVFYILFLLATCLISIVLYGIKHLKKTEKTTIPFAGILAIGYAVVLIFEIFNIFNPIKANYPFDL
jgi:hypothetical protein